MIVSRPPRASTRSRRPSRSAARLEPRRAMISKAEGVDRLAHARSSPSVAGAGARERVEPAQVDRSSRPPAGRCRARRRRRWPERRAAPRPSAAARRDRRPRASPGRSAARAAPSPRARACTARAISSRERMSGGGIRVRRLPGELQAERERDQVLVDAVVKVTLDRATICIRGQDESPPRGAELLELHPQSVELPLHVDLPSPQRDHLLPPDLGSCPSSRCPASSGPASLADGRASIALAPPAATVVRSVRRCLASWHAASPSDDRRA